MRIAVIADTHNRFPPDLPSQLAGADEIWHLGDVCDPDTLLNFEKLKRPLFIIRGNNDFFPRWPLTLDLRRDGLRFHLVHIPPAKPPAGCHVLLHGHTHIPRDDMIDGIRWLNPGCVSNPGRSTGPSFAWLTLRQGTIAKWEIVPLPVLARAHALRAQDMHDTPL